MGTHETDQIFEEYNSGTKTMEETNEALKESGANFHLEELTDEERAKKNQREDEAGFIENPNHQEALPQNVNLHRRFDLIGKPRCEREVLQHTAHGYFKVIYDDQGYAVSASKI